MRYVYQKWWVRFLIGSYDLLGNIVARRRHGPVQLPKRIVLLIPHQIGDLVIATPTIRAIRQMAPKAQLSIVTGSVPGSLLIANPWRAEVIPFDAAWQKVIRQFTGQRTNEIRSAKKTFLNLMRHLRPDVVMAFQPDLIANQLLAQSRTRVTIGFAEAGGGFLLTNPLVRADQIHQVEVLYQLAAKFADIFDCVLPIMGNPELPTPRFTTSSTQTILTKTNQRKSRLVVIHPFPSAPTKNWLPERWYALCQWLIKHDWNPVIIGGKSETSITLPPAILNLAGQLELPKTMALLTKAKLVIAIDSGPAHIAAALGTPVISIFSSVNDPRRWQPKGKKVTVLYAPVTDRGRYPLERRTLPKGTIGNPYTDGISVAMVTDAIQRLVAKSSQLK